MYFNKYRFKELIMIDDVKKAIEDIRPNLQADGGDIEFISLEDDGIVKVKLKGACNGCPMAQQTLKHGVERYLKQNVPSVTAVESV